MNIPHIAHNAGYQLDMLGRPIHVGDTILVKSYGSCSQDTFAIVKKVNSKSIVIDVNAPAKWERGPNGRWYKIPGQGTIPMKRQGKDTLVVNELAPISKPLTDAFITDHPELFI